MTQAQMAMDPFARLRRDQAKVFDVSGGRVVACEFVEKTKFSRFGDPPGVCSLGVSAKDFPLWQSDSYNGMAVHVRGRQYTADRVVGDSQILHGIPVHLYLILWRVETDSITGRRAVQQSLFDKLCTVKRPVATVSLDGSPGASVSVVASDVPCRLLNQATQSSLQERDTVSADTAVGQWLVELPFDADVQAGDTLVIGGRSFDVAGTDKGMSDAVCLTAVCRSTDEP